MWWKALLAALGAVAVAATVKEMPALRRELKIARM